MQVSDNNTNNTSNHLKNSETASIKNLKGFDNNRPPDPKLIDSCVHCGFCLSTCPSYRVIGKEMDSPRGRIYLMDAINEGEIALNTATTEHFDSCLGCLACVSTCPSGVEYDKLISATRHQVERNYPRSLPERLFRKLIFSLFPYPKILRFLLIPLFIYQKLGFQKLVRATGLLERISPRIAAMESILPQITLKSFQDNFPTIVPAQGKKRYRVGVILGCVQRLFFSPVNEATVRVLTANGCEVVIPKTQGCCAALPEHQGQTEQAKILARQMIDSFENTEVDFIVINAAGCGHTLKEYGHILADDPEYREKAEKFAAKVKDANEFLIDVGVTAKLSPLTNEPLTMVYQDACHLLHGQKISVQPRQLLRKIPGVKLREPIDAALCCGSAGVYNMLQPEVADELGKQKAQNLINTGADLITSANPGCSLQISKHLKSEGKDIKIMHPMELLDRAIRGVKLRD
ncbi:heterodisulfide reductase-related iron-sulfur binding cluster [Mastigocoleus sp. MO_188.B34]|uniref:(Fe-S)-binding protein n=1 Tax=Mastigocoleus sp. MO_188.B34 TaxID=3036635 RepID=UPI002634DCFF|nr:heterodisulfide reductase-related iron-sulfur binding cluster [Mastigocoleus sp. MO_188.B34]MDJ0694990.1 heterodisulfide reductase-related iron-sulfur binding cluster [Mastigocoleus sp. MO_188.B34]